MKQPTHDELDQREAALLRVLRMIRIYPPRERPGIRQEVAREFDSVDARRRGLLEMAKS